MASQQEIVIQDLHSTDFLNVVRSLLAVLKSCMGPYGRVKILVTGGGITVATSTSSRLTKNYLFSHPISILISQVMKSQNTTFGDNGLHTGLLVCNILEKVLKQDVIRQPQACELIQNLSTKICKILESKCVKIALDFSSVKQLIPIVRTILSSKPSCGLSKREIENFSVHIVQVFLSTINEDFGEIIVVKSKQSSDIKIFRGISYQVGTNEEFVKNLLIETNWNTEKGIPLLLFNMMLTPTEIERRDAKEVIVENDHDFLREAISLMECAVKIGVKLVACQKVVHNSLKLFLQRHNILLLHRMGAGLCEALEKLSGAKVVSSLNGVDGSLQSFIGYIDFVSYVSCGHQSFVLLQKKNANVATVHVPCLSEEAFEETKIVFHQALTALRQVTLRPLVMPGSGCLEAWLATQLKLQDTCETTSNRPQRAVVGWIQRSLLSIAGQFLPNKTFCCVDTVYCHSWQTWDPDEMANCCCGLVTPEDVKIADGVWVQPDFLSVNDLAFPQLGRFLEHPLVPNSVHENAVIDVFISKCNSIKLALDTSANMLNIGLIIHENV